MYKDDLEVSKEAILPWSDRMKKAMAYRKEGFNCAQATFAVFASEFGMTEAMALKTASGFGGGIGRRGEICGAVTGGVMAIGLCFGTEQLEVPPYTEQVQASKQITQEQVNAFCDEMTRCFGALDCKTLTGVDLKDPIARQKAKEAGVLDTVCQDLVVGAVATIERMMQL